MLNLTTLADRVWFAYHSLPRDERGEPPSYKALEIANGLTPATFYKVMNLGRKNLNRENFRALARSLRVSEHWLEFGGNDGPVPTGVVPPRPGMPWTRHGELPGWDEAVRIAASVIPPPVPRPAYLAGADLPVYRPVDRVSPELARAIAIYAWETSTHAEQAKYTSLETRATLAAEQSAAKARTVGRPAATVKGDANVERGSGHVRSEARRV